MMSNYPLPSDEKPSIMSFDKSTLVVLVAISLILTETFSGALRFYFDKAGLSALLYLPKVGCLALFALELLTLKAGRLLWVGMLLLLLSGAWAMLNGASISNVAFSLFVFGPLLFGMACSDHLLHRRRLLFWVIAACLIASLIGLLLDKYTVVPWKGYSYTVGNTELAANTAWSDDENDRLAGFTRVSNALSILIAIFSLYLMSFVRSRIMWAILFVVGFYSIVLTTSKAPAAAFAITLIPLTFSRLRWTSATIFVGIVAIGMLLPILSLMHNFDPNGVTTGDSLSSLYDRLVNTWPRLVYYMHSESYSLTGAGLGMFGSSQALFPVPGAGLLSGSDSSLMYLWGTFGVVGIALYVLQVPMFFVLRDRTSRMDRALLAISMCLCLISWTTDMFEVGLSNLFMGLSIGQVLCNSVNTSIAAHQAQDVSELSGLSELR
ncbi:MAG: putative rane protein [Pseudomonas sp.]|nr:putative rane protein [Pseudomonas sp.]